MQYYNKNKIFNLLKTSFFSSFIDTKKKMHSFIMKITHSLAAKDTIAVARGFYKVVQGGVASYRADNVEVKSHNSWHNKSVFVAKP